MNRYIEDWCRWLYSHPRISVKKCAAFLVWLLLFLSIIDPAFHEHGYPRFALLLRSSFHERIWQKNWLAVLGGMTLFMLLSFCLWFPFSKLKTAACGVMLLIGMGTSMGLVSAFHSLLMLDRPEDAAYVLLSFSIPVLCSGLAAIGWQLFRRLADGWKRT